MAKNIHIVFSQPPDRISDEEFNRWYDPHLDEILVVPGFVSAQRYRLEAMVEKPGTSVPYGFLSLYELEGDVPTDHDRPGRGGGVRADEAARSGSRRSSSPPGTATRSGTRSSRSADGRPG